ncbi:MULTISPECIES: TetR/AcrR family transcriptional regulator [Nocardiopsis]|uniref:AcrR family transcriptional regulator n=1 Tax=Nocardiopsis sinuspersici TaxID=501010 RepID=A0A1V3C5T8_9ACTN|nr:MULTISPECIES: TetR/AcrR family transcriptional regulator [Nocardiopsis]NYH52221.1 AcrR family transcriptional regulator [Nocardiopsis sinuspersici]OOC55740.1 TetR family transcriptional regulator [Nocardiopsis sinuspersici]
MADRPYHHGDLRAALLANAERALAEHGPAALSLRELAREAGVSHAAPGRHFRDKQALLDALALTGFERLIGRLAEASASGGSARAQVLAMARAYVGFAMEHKALLDLMYAHKHDPDVSEQLADAVSRLKDMLVRPIVDGQAAGEIAGGDPVVLASVVSATLHGITVFSATVSPEEVDAGLADVVHVLFEGLAPR